MSRSSTDDCHELNKGIRLFLFNSLTLVVSVLMMLTLRKKIAEVLKEESFDLREISKRFGIKEKEALDHLKHIEKSMHPKHLIVEPASCKECGFSFKKRTRLNAPGRCPVCRSEQIFPPRFKINSP